MSSSQAATTPQPTTLFDDLIARVAAQPDAGASLETLLAGLAERIKTTSNDQNVQRLARALRESGPALARAVGAM